MTEGKATAAYFDFDRTIVDGDAGVLFAKELLRLQRRRLRDLSRGTLGWAARNIAWETRLLTRYTRMALLAGLNNVRVVKRSRMIRVAYQLMHGMDAREMRELGNDFFNDVLAARIYHAARDAMDQHHKEGRRVVVVSTGMHTVIDPVKRHLPVDDVIAVTLEEDDGRVTGKVTGPLWGADKADAVRTYAHQHDLSLPRSYAYTDHHSDLALLQAVGHPVCINPTRALARHARAHQWPIHAWKR